MAHGRTLLIVNPAARHGETEPLIPVIEQLLANLPHDMRSRAPRVMPPSLQPRPRATTSWSQSGGDGTVHEVLNGLMRHPAEQRPAARAAAHRLGQRHAANARHPDRPRAGGAGARDRRAAPLRRGRVQRRLLQQLLRGRTRRQGHRQGDRVQSHHTSLGAVAVPVRAAPRALHGSLPVQLRIPFDGAAEPRPPTR